MVAERRQRHLVQEARVQRRRTPRCVPSSPLCPFPVAGQDRHHDRLVLFVGVRDVAGEQRDLVEHFR